MLRLVVVSVPGRATHLGTGPIVAVAVYVAGVAAGVFVVVDVAAVCVVVIVYEVVVIVVVACCCCWW